MFIVSRQQDPLPWFQQRAQIVQDLRRISHRIWVLDLKIFSPQVHAAKLIHPSKLLHDLGRQCSNILIVLQSITDSAKYRMPHCFV
jgi:hypothetical protein